MDLSCKINTVSSRIVDKSHPPSVANYFPTEADKFWKTSPDQLPSFFNIDSVDLLSDSIIDGDYSSITRK